MEDLEQIIAALIERKYSAAPGSAAQRMAERQLRGLRLSHQEAGPIEEELDLVVGASVAHPALR